MSEDEKVEIAVLKEKVRSMEETLKGVTQKLWGLVALILAYIVNNLMGVIGK